MNFIFEQLTKYPFLISIVVAFYNNATNGKTLKLINDLTKLPPYIQLIFVDDGSDAKTASFLDQFKSDRCSVIHQQNSGVFLAYTNGFKAASGYYLHGLDADDDFDTSFYEDVYNIISEEKILPDVFAFPRRFLFLKDNELQKTIELPLNLPTGYNKITDSNFATFFIPDNPNKIDGFRWNKLLRADYLKEYMQSYSNIFSRPFIYSEDNLHTFPVYLKANDVYVLEKSYYDYYLYNGSASKKPQYFISYLNEYDDFFNFFKDIIKKSGRPVPYLDRLEVITYISCPFLGIVHGYKEVFKAFKKDKSYKTFLKRFKKYNFWGYVAFKLHLFSLFRRYYHKRF